MKQDSNIGATHPLGAALVRGGANFSLFSRSASRVELLFFDRADDAWPSRTVELNPRTHRTYHYWHAFVPGVEAGQLYGYRVHGPSDPARGKRFDPTKVLLDPYGRGVVVPPKYSRAAAAQPGDNAALSTASSGSSPSPCGHNPFRVAFVSASLPQGSSQARNPGLCAKIPLGFAVPRITGNRCVASVKIPTAHLPSDGLPRLNCYHQQKPQNQERL